MIAVLSVATTVQRIWHVHQLSDSVAGRSDGNDKGEPTRWLTHNGKSATNGNRTADGKIRVAIVGVGNCASSLVQGRYYYEDAKETDFVPGLMHVNLGGYHVRDIEFVAAFDVDKDEGRQGPVGGDLRRARTTPIKFADVPHTGVTVERGMTHDGLGKYLSQVIEKAPGPTADVVGILKERKVDVMVSYLPVGSEEATKWYVEQALQAGVGFINAIPVFIGREPYWQRRFAEKGLPIIGDDIKSQVGATITHRVLTRLFMDRGVRIDRTYQLNFGGNTDFLNMLERERLESKKISKTNAVTSMLDYEIGDDDVHVGPSDYVPWLKDRKWCHIRMEGTTFGDVPLNLELKLEVWDSPNSAGVITDAIRCAKLGLDRGLAGTLVAPSVVLHEVARRIQIHDDVAYNRVEAFIRGDDNETLDGTQAPERRKLRKLAGQLGEGGRERRLSRWLPLDRCSGGEIVTASATAAAAGAERKRERLAFWAYRAGEMAIITRSRAGWCCPSRPRPATSPMTSPATSAASSARTWRRAMGLPADHRARRSRRAARVPQLRALPG